MNTGAYLFTINKNNSYRLDPDELKDVEQEAKVYLSQKNYNDEMTRRTIQDHYRRAVKKKVKNEELILSNAYMENFEEEGNFEQEQDRLEKLEKLNLQKKQRKIVELLIKGYTYKEICGRLKISEKQLINKVYCIKKKNTEPSQAQRRA